MSSTPQTIIAIPKPQPLQQGVDPGSEATALQETTVLSNISITVRAGERIGICGGVGEGKSTLLLGMFGELKPSCGEIHPPPAGASIAYAPQVASPPPV